MKDMHIRYAVAAVCVIATLKGWLALGDINTDVFGAAVLILVAYVISFGWVLLED